MPILPSSFNPNQERSLYKLRQEKYQKKHLLSSHPKLEEIILIRNPSRQIKTPEKFEKSFYYNDFCEIPSVSCFFSIISSFSNKEDQLKKKKLSFQVKIDLLNRLRDERCSNNQQFSEKYRQFSGKSKMDSANEVPFSRIKPITIKDIKGEGGGGGRGGEGREEEGNGIRGGRGSEREGGETISGGGGRIRTSKKLKSKIYPSSIDFCNLKLTEREVERQMLQYVTSASKPPKQLQDADILLNSPLFKHSKTINSAFETYLNRFSIKNGEDDIKSALVRTDRKISEGMRRIEEIEGGRKRGKSNFGREI